MIRRGDLITKCIALFQLKIILLSIVSFAFLVSNVYLTGAQDSRPESRPGAGTPAPAPSGYQIVNVGGTLYYMQTSTGSLFDITSTGLPGSPGAPPNGALNNPSDTSRITATPGGTPELTGSEVVSGVTPGTIFHGIPGAGDVPSSQIDSVAQVGDQYALLDSNGHRIGDLLSKDQYADFQKFATENGGSLVKPFEGPFGLMGGPGYLLSGFLWAAGVAAAIQGIGRLVGLDQGLTDALSIGAAAGIFAFRGLQSLGPSGFNVLGADNFLVANAGWIGLGVGVLFFLLLYKEESAKQVAFQCLPWEAPVGGAKCEECNKDSFRPCSEYRCKSLGQACEIVNAGSKDEKCVWVNPKDVSEPTITPWNTPLTDGHRYTSHDSLPPSRGTKIIKTSVTNGCLAAFTPLTFGVLTNEPAQCKIDLNHKNSFDEMQFYFNNSNLFEYNHTETFSLPSPSSVNAAAPELKNNGKYDFFVRCRDKNGNANVAEFAIQFCVDPSPDTTAPVIVDTSITSGSPVRFGVGGTPLQVYVNEPADCKWSTQDKDYGLMENNMSCATNLTQINSRELFTCNTNLTGIVDRVENKFYFRCKDQPGKPENERNVNKNSYPFSLRGSQPLNIIRVGPNATITGSTQTVGVDLTVTTDDGSDEGKAICSFSPTGVVGSFIPMFETNSFEHKQHLNLGTGNYNYQFRCVDLGGNAAQANTSFNVFVDSTPPLITRAYHDSANNALKIVTNEDAECAYSRNSCNYNFNESVKLKDIAPSKRDHYAEWQQNIVYYLKCRDLFGNEPAPNSCSLIASATSIV